MNIDQNTDIISMDDLLDGTLDDLKDMPAFKVYPAGAHKVKLQWEMKKIGEQNAPSVKFCYVELAELNDPTAEVPEAGDECEVAFLFKNKDGTRNEYAEGGFKSIITALKSLAAEGATPRQIMEASNGVEVLALTDVRLKDKKDPKSQQYLQIKEIALI